MDASQPHGILVVDDDPSVLKLVRLQLAEEGFHPITATTGEEALQRAKEESPELVVLDVVLPDASGIEVMERLREWRPVPVILLTGKVGTRDLIHGLEVGADDYLSKPFNPEELAARVRAVLRRTHRSEPGAEPIVIDGLVIDLDRRLVLRDGVLVPLTRTEWSLLEVLVRHRGKALRNGELIGKVWGPEYLDDLQYLRVWISRLRRKLEPEGARGSLIRNFPGIGYVFQDAVPAETAGADRAGA